ncbi:MAG TPA: glucose-6-phosphate dehydrogenase [Candidatus Binataceae bacterium]|nr:glucose-6-phosphate dehydrogenase [Candidatus Binataceae bacterium]
MPNEKERSLEQARRGDPCIMVIFGGAGDLTKRKLIPALYNLEQNHLLPDEFGIVGVSSAQLSSDDYREKLGQEIREFATTRVEPESWDWFSKRLYYMSGEFSDSAAYNRLRDVLKQAEAERGTKGNYLFYLATAPRFFGEIVKQLGAAGLAQEENGQWRRVIIEKPFGHDLDSARSLNREIKAVLDERQIYRIDHYLGKETVQNIMALRFSNGIFEPIWNRRYIDHVQVTVAETVGVEQRGGYYDEAGALRDMVPNHIMQLIALVTMEPPISFEAEAVRDEKSKIIHAIQPLSPEDVLTHAVRGQYGPGMVDGERAAGYREEPNVAPSSSTDTFAALKLQIDNWRWAEVPIYLRTGKRMAKRVTEIAIQFRRAPFLLFRKTSVEELAPNLLVLHIQPNEGISLRFGAKIPGPVMQLGSVNMNFEYSDYFGAAPSTGYETLLHDCMIGDATLFQRGDMIEAGWSVVTPLLDVWKALPPRNFPNYAAGAWGPREAEELLRRDGRQWRDIE